VLVRPKIVWLVFLFLVLQLSCAHREPLPPAAEIRKNLGTIGVASGCFKPECSLQKRTSELASGALRGAFEAEGKCMIQQPQVQRILVKFVASSSHLLQCAVEP